MLVTRPGLDRDSPSPGQATPRAVRPLQSRRRTFVCVVINEGFVFVRQTFRNFSGDFILW